jgi:eukaryotic translation initiation factor 2C
MNSRVLQRFLRGEQSHDQAVLTAIMVRACLIKVGPTSNHASGQALNIAIRMAPSLRYPSNARSFFTDRETRPIVGGVVLWRGYFQSVRPAINKLLINIDISTGAMYQPGDLISLALDFLGKSGQPNALAPNRGLPDRERLRLQQFLTGIKVTTPYQAHNPNRQRLVKKLTRESALDRRFDIGDGETMTVMEYFHNQLNIQLQFPDLICVEVCTTLFLFSGGLSYHVAFDWRRNPTGALRSSTRSTRS